MADRPQPKLSIDQVLWECFVHFVHTDEANAAIHMAPVRYSPITFRLTEHLALIPESWMTPRNFAVLREVHDALGKYAEDTGR
jgi:hypothetical protein